MQGITRCCGHVPRQTNPLPSWSGKPKLRNMAHDDLKGTGMLLDKQAPDGLQVLAQCGNEISVAC